MSVYATTPTLYVRCMTRHAPPPHTQSRHHHHESPSDSRHHHCRFTPKTPPHGLRPPPPPRRTTTTTDTPPACLASQHAHYHFHHEPAMPPPMSPSRIIHLRRHASDIINRRQNIPAKRAPNITSEISPTPDVIPRSMPFRIRHAACMPGVVHGCAHAPPTLRRRRFHACADHHAIAEERRRFIRTRQPSRPRMAVRAYALFMFTSAGLRSAIPSHVRDAHATSTPALYACFAETAIFSSDVERHADACFIPLRRHTAIAARRATPNIYHYETCHEHATRRARI